ncbi:MAG: LON peptidase substrate-binding domain-containing protein [Planctomycetes bacterium]|nr:LON peptidase substrate-binding domain-containing protein [Planctomycetota bacterium]
MELKPETPAGLVRLFPLPGTVLFPKTVLPLHIFEPRYRAMVADALESDRLIAMALLKPGWKSDYHGNPPVFDVVGIGRIFQEQLLEEGKYNLLLHGLIRGRIEHHLGAEPYRRALVKLLPEPPAPASPDLERVRRTFLAVFSSLVQSLDKTTSVKIEPDLPLGTLCDVLTSFLDVDAYAKQAVLEQIDVRARAETVLGLLRRSSWGNVRRRAPSWPPEPSAN